VFVDHSEPAELYRERLRAADDARLARQLQHQPSHHDRPGSLRRTAGALLIDAGLRLRGEFPVTPQPATRRPA
jgi:hypothetical protein